MNMRNFSVIALLCTGLMSLVSCSLCAMEKKKADEQVQQDKLVSEEQAKLATEEEQAKLETEEQAKTAEKPPERESEDRIVNEAGQPIPTRPPVENSLSRTISKRIDRSSTASGVGEGINPKAIVSKKQQEEAQKKEVARKKEEARSKKLFEKLTYLTQEERAEYMKRVKKGEQTVHDIYDPEKNAALKASLMKQPGDSPAEIKRKKIAYKEAVANISHYLFERAASKDQAFSSGTMVFKDDDGKLHDFLFQHVKDSYKGDLYKPIFVDTTNAGAYPRESSHFAAYLKEHGGYDLEKNKRLPEYTHYGIDLNTTVHTLPPKSDKTHLLFGKLPNGHIFVKFEEYGLGGVADAALHGARLLKGHENEPKTIPKDIAKQFMTLAPNQQDANKLLKNNDIAGISNVLKNMKSPEKTAELDALIQKTYPSLTDRREQIARDITSKYKELVNKLSQDPKEREAMLVSAQRKGLEEIKRVLETQDSPEAKALKVLIDEHYPANTPEQKADEENRIGHEVRFVHSDLGLTPAISAGQENVVTPVFNQPKDASEAESEKSDAIGSSGALSVLD